VAAVLRALAIGGGAVLLGLMVLVAFDVVMRYVLRLPFLGAYEITELAMALIVFLGLPYCAITGGHVAVDILAPLLDRPRMRWPNALVHLAGAAITAVMAWQAVLYAETSQRARRGDEHAAHRVVPVRAPHRGRASRSFRRPDR
jgi:TRAP-type transport system small permease protein